MNIRVILADDHDILREGLQALLVSESDIEVVGEAENGRMAVQLARELAPHVVVMDVAMPDLSGIEATRQITAANPSTKVIGLSMHSDKRFVAQMLVAGAAGYLPKGCKAKELVQAIRTAMLGQTYLSSCIARVVTEDYVRYMAEGSASELSPLTPREREVLQLLSEGKNAKAISSLLRISIKTVSSHRRGLMRKLGAPNMAALVKFAVREGMTPLEG